MATTLPSGNTQALPGISLSPPRQTGQNVYSLHAEQPPSPLSRCAFRLRLSGHFLLLVTKKKALYTVYVEIYSICFYKATNFAVFENKKKRALCFGREQCREIILFDCAVFPEDPGI